MAINLKSDEQIDLELIKYSEGKLALGRRNGNRSWEMIMRMQCSVKSWQMANT